MRTRFGEFLLDSDARRLERNGQALHLTGKAFDLLALLVAERPRVISKDDLLDRIWPDVVVAAENIKNIVAEIRHELDSPQEWIRTVHHVGYAFAGEAREEEAAAAEARAWLYYSGKVFPLSSGRTYVGRDDACDVRLDSPGVSRRHACISIDGDVATIEDLGSKNGTRVGETRVIQPLQLRDRDRIRIASCRLTFRAQSEVAPTVTEASGSD